MKAAPSQKKNNNNKLEVEKEEQIATRLPLSLVTRARARIQFTMRATTSISHRRVSVASKSGTQRAAPSALPTRATTTTTTKSIEPATTGASPASPCPPAPSPPPFASRLAALALAAALAVAPLSPLVVAVAPAHARLEGVNKPVLLPKGPVTPVLDVAGFLTDGERARLRAQAEALEKDTGVRLRVLAQNYPETPGLAIKEYWGVDDDTVVFVASACFSFTFFFKGGEKRGRARPREEEEARERGGKKLIFFPSLSPLKK